MGKSAKKIYSSFELEGRFLRFGVAGKYGPETLWLASATGEKLIKLAKPLREPLSHQLSPGDWLQIAGEKKIDLSKGICQLKAETVSLRRPQGAQSQVQVLPQAPPAPPCASAAKCAGKAKILVCQKSARRKRGSMALAQALQSTLCDRGLENQVTVQATGCMKDCKKGPNLIFMPDKQRYQRVSPAEIPQLVEKHLSGGQVPQVKS